MSTVRRRPAARVLRIARSDVLPCVPDRREDPRRSQDVAAGQVALGQVLEWVVERAEVANLEVQVNAASMNRHPTQTDSRARILLLPLREELLVQVLV